MNTTETQDTATTDPTANPSTDPSPRAADVVIDLAATWAQHGLTVGKLALEASAKTLQDTAKLLESIRASLGRDTAAPDTTAPAGPASPAPATADE